MNGSGSFDRIKILPSSKKGMKTFICIPTGVNASGWRRLAEAMADLVGVAVKDKQPVLPKVRAASHVLPISPHKSFAEAMIGKDRCGTKGSA